MRAELICDIHTHILPNIDDGSTSLSESVEMLNQLIIQNIAKAVLTPHFYAFRDTPEVFLEKRELSLKKLLSFLPDQIDKDIELMIGAEVHYYEGISSSRQLGDLCISGTNLLLLELPMKGINERIVTEIAKIRENRGIIPIIAHIDRYPYLKQKNLELLRRTSLLQLNTSSIVEGLCCKKQIKQIESGLVSFLGTDCHNMTSRIPNFEKAAKKLYSKLGDNETDNFFAYGSHLLKDAVRVNRK